VGAMQGLRPERVVYTGSTSKMLAPALRLAWCVLPRELVGALIGEKALDDMGTPVLEQLALADFLERGELDRHLRRMRPRYRARREALAVALERHLPGARLAGVTAGLYAVALLPGEVDEVALIEAALARGVAVHGLAAARFDPKAGPPGLVLGYGSQPEATIERGIAELGRVLREQHG
jgi:GntR family transcriptional regulator / MocR family aminotransferase